jgi:hypothetical protein
MKLSGFEHILYIEKFHMEKNTDHHGSCKVTALIREKDVIAYTGKVETIVTVTDSEQELFIGKITKISLEKDIDGGRMEITISSLSMELEGKTQARVFQNPKKSYRDIVDTISGSNISVKMKDTDVAQQLLKDPVVQWKETDYGCLLRMSKKLKWHIFCDCSSRKELILATDLGTMAFEVQFDDLLSYSLTSGADGRSLVVTPKKKLEYGKRISLEGIEYLICSHRIDKVAEEYIHTYRLEEIQYNKASVEEVMDELYLEACVKDHNDPQGLGRVQLEFLEPFSDINGEERLWIPVDSLYSSNEAGIVFLPDIGNLVTVRYFRGGFSVCASIRTKEIAEEYQNPSDKMIISRNGQIITFQDDKIMMLSKDTKFVLGDDSIELKIGDSNILLEKDRLKININKTCFELSDLLNISVPGEIVLDAKDTINIKSNNITISGKGGVSIN